MSGNRSLHRQQVTTANAKNDEDEDNDVVAPPIWNLEMIHTKNGTKLVWMAVGDGSICCYKIVEKTLLRELDAAALTLDPIYKTKSIPTQLGCTQISVVRNYLGEDPVAGDMIVASLNMVGRVQIYNIAEETKNDAAEIQQVKTIEPVQDFCIQESTGTICALCPPRLNPASMQQVVVMAVGCLDGSIRIVSTGIATPLSLQQETSKSKKKIPNAGTVVDTIGTSNNYNNNLVTSIKWHPTSQAVLVVGRQDGTIDLHHFNNNNNNNTNSLHFALHHPHVRPVRGLDITQDGQLLLAGCDDGRLSVWDIGHLHKKPALVHSVVDAHDEGWILDLVSVGKHKFVTAGSDGKLKLWTLSGQGSYTPLFTFATDVEETSTPWTIAAASCGDDAQQQQPRLVAGTEKGYLQVFSLEV